MSTECGAVSVVSEQSVRCQSKKISEQKNNGESGVRAKNRAKTRGASGVRAKKESGNSNPLLEIFFSEMSAAEV